MEREAETLGLVHTVVRRIDALNDWVGRATSWLALLLVVVTSYDVMSRYLFRQSFVFVQELEWHLFAVLFLAAAGYTHLKGDHVRVDIIYARLSPRRKAWVNLVCGVVFLFPTAFLLVWTSIPFVAASVKVLEGSPDPGGIPGRFLLKAVIPLGFILVGLQGVSETIKNLLFVLGKEAPK
ncbi:MAG: TRAP transporter small permease subunit [Candidatus Rokubacteria bacterium]|nr:TRAP transporter small permease subunit [Candidatus Rokubacteria bacterium]